MRLSSTADRLAGELYGKDLEFRSVSIDTRTIQEGDLYLAICGKMFDGNSFVAEAQQRGACAAVVSRLSDVDLPQILVEDTTLALGQIALLNRLASEAILVGITGSQGKTTVKEMTGSILARIAPTLVTSGNFNNAIGVPLTLLELQEKHRFGVIEMGANHAGEIAYCTNLVKPDVSVITNAARAHIEGFGSLEGVAEAKGEIIDGLGSEGIMVLNRDDQFFERWRNRAGARKIVSFSVSGKEADYVAEHVERGQDGKLSFRITAGEASQPVTLALLGRHNISNALAAAASAVEAGATLEQVRTGMASISPVKGRLCPVDNVLGGTLIDDSYNASPDSFRAAVDVLADFSGHRILLAGDMAELGSTSKAEHVALGEYARKVGIDEFWSIGEESHLSSRAFGADARHFENKEMAIHHCRDKLKPGVTLLVKGSRSAGLDEIIRALASGSASEIK